MAWRYSLVVRLRPMKIWTLPAVNKTNLNVELSVSRGHIPSRLLGGVVQSLFVLSRVENGPIRRGNHYRSRRLIIFNRVTIERNKSKTMINIDCRKFPIRLLWKLQRKSNRKMIYTQCTDKIRNSSGKGVSHS